MTSCLSISLVFDKLCSADLNGFLVRVPCDTAAVIHHEYGAEDWLYPNPEYNFHRDSKNYRDNGTWTKEEWGVGGRGEVYSLYHPDGTLFSGKVGSEAENGTELVTSKAVKRSKKRRDQ